MEIGLLLPENTGYPQLADHYLTGFEAMLLSQSQEKTYLGIQPKYYNVSDDSFYRKIKSMLFEADVDVVVVHASISLISGVWDLFHQNEKILVASVLGEKVGVSLPVSPYIYINSLNLWQSNWGLGHWVAQNIGHKVALVNSFYDAGYDSGNTFRLGFEAGGGKQMGIFMIDPPQASFNPGAVIREVESFSPNAIFANLSGIAATAFLNAYLKSSLKGKIELVASPLALTEKALVNIGDECCGIKSVFTWSTVLDNEVNTRFITLLHGKKVEVPDVFHLLGFEVAKLLHEAEQRAGTTTFDTRLFSLSLESLKMDSPRGLMTMDCESHISSSPYYLREVRKTESGLVNQVISQQLDVIDENDEEIRREYSGLTSGWINPYLTT